MAMKATNRIIVLLLLHGRHGTTRVGMRLRNLRTGARHSGLKARPTEEFVQPGARPRLGAPARE